MRDCTADFAAGQLTALIGRNGSGKTTLLRALAGLTGDYSGRILIGENPLGKGHAGRGRSVAFVGTARVRVAEMRVGELVALGRSPYTGLGGRLSADDRLIVERSLRLTGMEPLARRRLDSLSDGEAQRAMIARALAQATPVILLDEPTSFLDIPGRRRLAELLSSLAHDQGKCILFSTHELSLAAAYADNAVLLRDGRLQHLQPDEIEADEIFRDDRD